ncbi:MAG: hypothetical protein M3O20_01155 [Acidobacteriota bacterium]|nr:hypothetical protein [Acidobacteriota bacterium]
MSIASFEDAFADIVGEEGKLSMDESDPGNWTGGVPHVGTLKGTKYGVSAKEYPALDIANLTLVQARAIAKRDYWDKVHGDELPIATAFMMFDEAYNTGVEESVKCAQAALDLYPDGQLGPKTLAALKQTAGIEEKFGIGFTVHRVVAYSEMAGWKKEGSGWATRAVRTLAKAIT